MKKRIKYKVTSDRLSCYAKGKYRLCYDYGTTVTAPLGTYGIMVFDTLKQAKDFMYNKVILDAEILDVQPIGRGKKVKIISRSQSQEGIELFYEINPSKRRDSPRKLFAPKGTVCYPSVKVLK